MMNKFIFVLLFTASAFVQISFAQRQSFYVPPQTTDPNITMNLNNHYVSINRVAAAKNQLFLFFPGTGGIAFNSREINNTAADMGFHAINLNYTSDLSVNEMCNSGTDLDCYGNMRLEIIDGTDRTNLVNINRANSAENRLIKLLIYMRNQFPNDNWGQFLNGDQTIKWSKIVVSGHSQGGGHAGIIGRYHSVTRVIMFAAMDFNGMTASPANWIARPETTPNASAPDKFWGFSHQRDDSVNFFILSNRVWTAFGMPQFGAVVNVDGTNPPYNNTHSLTTNLDCEEPHSCVVADPRLIRLPDGTPIYKPVWQYLLSNTNSPLAIDSLRILRGDTIVNQMPVGITTKYYKLSIEGNSFENTSRVFINGREAETEFISQTQIRAKLPAGKTRSVGSSTLQVRNSDNAISNQITF